MDGRILVSLEARILDIIFYEKFRGFFFLFFG